jgi:hypothetical protein
MAIAAKIRNLELAIMFRGANGSGKDRRRKGNNAGD